MRPVPYIDFFSQPMKLKDLNKYTVQFLKKIMYIGIYVFIIDLPICYRPLSQ